jgi:hypothetical protein
MKRLKTSLQGTTASPLFKLQHERFIAAVTDHYKRQNMSGQHFLAW